MTDIRTGIPNPLDSDETQIAVGRGQFRFYGERNGGRPFNNCLIDCALMGEEWQGYRIPEGYDDVVRAAAGVPDPRGTSLAEVYRGLKALFPMPGTIVHLTIDELLAKLKRVNGRGRRKSTFATIVNTKFLPEHYQRLAGQNYDGLHGIYVFAKSETPVLSIAFSDPMGRDRPSKGASLDAFEPYTYELISIDDLTPALHHFGDGVLDAIEFVKNAARP